MRIACGFDHAGVPLREAVLDAVEVEGHEALDLGVRDSDPVDYPRVAVAVGTAVTDGRADRGIIVCGSGAGVAVAACKIDGVRAAVIHDHYTARQAVEHDDVNALCLGARVIGPATARDLVRAYLDARFTGEERHQRRLGEVQAIERDGAGAVDPVQPPDDGER